MTSTSENTQKKNNIHPTEHGVDVTLDPSFLLKHALYMPDGERIMKAQMTPGQAIEAIAFAHIKAKLPHLASLCNCATIIYRDGKFEVKFADSQENLAF
jgi:hypothetical protein